MSTFASSVTGLTPKETASAYQALEVEGIGAPDPSREEVDEFLEKQVFRVRHEPDLTEKRRNSIVSRLQAAIGRITPNGATFHALKNLVAESWSRVRRKAAAAFVLGALTFSVGACGNVPDDNTAPDKADYVAAAPADPAPSTDAGDEFDTTFKDVKPSIGQDAVVTFGMENATDGTSAAVDVTQDYSFNGEWLTLSRPEGNEEVMSIGERMVPETQKFWNKTVREYGQTEGQEVSEASQNLFSLTFYDSFDEASINGKTLEANPDGPAFVNPQITSVKTTVSSDDRLQVRVKSSADMRFLLGGKPKMGQATRDTTFYMVIGSEGTWVISAWSGTLSFGDDIRPDK